jgi:hypothetical protein
LGIGARAIFDDVNGNPFLSDQRGLPLRATSTDTGAVQTLPLDGRTY